MFAEILRESPFYGHATLKNLVPYAYQLSEQITGSPDILELASLIRRASELSN